MSLQNYTIEQTSQQQTNLSSKVGYSLHIIKKGLQKLITEKAYNFEVKLGLLVLSTIQPQNQSLYKHFEDYPVLIIQYSILRKLNFFTNQSNQN